MEHASLIQEYLAGPAVLRETVGQMSASALDAKPISGKWTTREVVCHIADFEVVYADRMKRVIAENEPTFFGGDPDLFAAKLAYRNRDIEEELQLIQAVRRHTGRILDSLAPADFQRTGIHSEDGPVSLGRLLLNITEHLPHHVRFIQEKRRALGLS